MTIPSRGTPEFWRLYRSLPSEVRVLAQKNYHLWSANAFYPSSISASSNRVKVAVSMNYIAHLSTHGGYCEC